MLFGSEQQNRKRIGERLTSHQLLPERTVCTSAWLLLSGRYYPIIVARAQLIAMS